MELRGVLYDSQEMENVCGVAALGPYSWTASPAEPSLRG